MKLTFPHYQSAKAVIKALAERRETDWDVCTHASEEMGDDAIDILDIRSALIRAEHVTEQQDGRYLVRGKDVNLQIIEVVIEVEENPPEIFVITVWKIARRWL